jgi:flagellar protein FlgJ
MMLGSPRYQGVRGHGGDIAGFAAALQHSGYATDPHYARKLLAVAQSPTMRQALAAVGLSAGSSLATP